MVSTIASLGILVSANTAPAMREMDNISGKVKDVGQTSQKEGAKTESFMKRWAGGFAAIGAAAAASLYMIVKASPLLAGAIQEAQDAINLLFMTIGDALEPVLRPFVDMLWGLSDLVLDMPPGLDAVTAALITFGGAIVAAAGGLALISGGLHAFGIGCATAGAHAALLVGILGGVVTVAGLVAAGLYYISGEPTVAIMGALTTIGIGATILFHHPVIFAVTSIVSAFVMMAGECGNMETLVSAAFLSIGVAATALMGHPVIAAIVGIVGGITLLIRSSADLEIKILAVFTSIGIAASVLMAHPLIAAVTLAIDAIYLLKKATDALLESWKKFSGEKVGRKLLIERALSSPFQYGGYVPYTGPAFLHAGEYVVPRGKVGAGAGGGGGSYVDNRTFNFDIHDMTLAGDMDVDRLKARLDELYKREMGQVA